jgi:hypothetical protein
MGQMNSTQADRERERESDNIVNRMLKNKIIILNIIYRAQMYIMSSIDC